MTHHTSDYPKKIRDEITKACYLIESASVLEDTVAVELEEKKILDIGYSYPQWLKLMIDWKQRNIVLTTEEYFKKNYNRFTDKEYSLLKSAIDELYLSNDDEAYRQSLYAIAFQILIGCDEFDDGLAFKWHCLTESISITNKNAFSVFKSLLEREIAFWDVSAKPVNRFNVTTRWSNANSAEVDISGAEIKAIQESQRQIIRNNISKWQQDIDSNRRQRLQAFNKVS